MLCPRRVYTAVRGNELWISSSILSGGGHSLGEEGGEAEHTITVDEMPSHEHAGRIVGDMSSKNDAIAMNTSWSKYQTIGDFTNDIRDRNNAATKPHNNMPPYLAVTAWKRIE